MTDDSLFEGRTASYQSAFREAYYQRATERRKVAVLKGLLAGPVLGLGLLLLVAFSVPT